MADTNTTPETQAHEPQHEKQSRLQSFKDNHPKTRKVAGATVAALAVVGSVVVMKALRKDKPTEQPEAEVVQGEFESYTESPTGTES